MREPFPKARTYITTLLMLEFVLGLLIIFIAAISQLVLGSYLASSERKALTNQFFNAYTIGFQLVVTYLCSITMWRRIWPRRCTPNVRMLLNVWMFFCFLIVLCGFGSIWTLLTSGDALEHTVEAALKKGIDLYYTCPEWKLLWDSLQYNHECCGVHSYKDWMCAEWMPTQAPEPPAPEAAPGCPEEKKEPTVLAPYACCQHNCSSCYQNYVPGNANAKIPDITLSQINGCGCMPIFASFLWKMLYWLLALVLIALKLDLLLCALTKYIVNKQADLDDSCAGSNMGLTDDEGRPLVIVKCPPNVRCVTFDEDESSNCQCDNMERGSCSCCGGGAKKKGVKSRESRILH